MSAPARTRQQVHVVEALLVVVAVPAKDDGVEVTAARVATARAEEQRPARRSTGATSATSAPCTTSIHTRGVVRGVSLVREKLRHVGHRVSGALAGAHSERARARPMHDPRIQQEQVVEGAAVGAAAEHEQVTRRLGLQRRSRVVDDTVGRVARGHRLAPRRSAVARPTRVQDQQLPKAEKLLPVAAAKHHHVLPFHHARCVPRHGRDEAAGHVLAATRAGAPRGACAAHVLRGVGGPTAAATHAAGPATRLVVVVVAGLRHARVPQCIDDGGVHLRGQLPQHAGAPHDGVVAHHEVYAEPQQLQRTVAVGHDAKGCHVRHLDHVAAAPLHQRAQARQVHERAGAQHGSGSHQRLGLRVASEVARHAVN
mmetsp:Transcript_5210/g.18732  ORF Transcript_5210/g.18732 Transcript_5210/m.18732 type:complete len:369 (-) Transcript_5210:1739-2845(-)